jgi:hypothetical protein
MRRRSGKLRPLRCAKVTSFAIQGYGDLGRNYCSGWWFATLVRLKPGDNQMRDIRGDLQDRVNLFAEQIAAQDQFDKLIDQLKREHETRLIGLKSELDTARMVIGIEDRRAGSSPPASNIQFEVRPPHQSRPQPGQSHPDSPHAGIILTY